jgi:hypothetical protein
MRWIVLILSLWVVGTILLLRFFTVTKEGDVDDSGGS